MERKGQRVTDCLAKLDVFKSTEPDEIRPAVFKEVAETMSGSLAIIFENSWRTGEIPEDGQI